MFDLVAFITYVAIVMYTPGPNNIMSMTHSQRYGFLKTLDFMLGVFTGVSILVFLSCYFNLFLFENVTFFKSIVGPLGAIYMVYLAWLIIRPEKHTESTKKGKGYANKSLISYPTGVLLQFLNPKGVIFALTVSSNFILPFFEGNLAYIIFSIGLGLAAFSSVSIWGGFGALFNRFFSQYGKVFNYLMAGFLVYSAISISGILTIFK
jgi:threonine/homoserine/homoserine lactone efflux protein